MMAMLVAAALLLHFLPQDDPNFYQWCMDNFSDENYCCQEAGGEITGWTVNGAICGSKSDNNSPPPITVTRQPPPVIFPSTS